MKEKNGAYGAVLFFLPALEYCRDSNSALSMNYQNKIEVAAPLARVIELFDNPENLNHWQPNFVSFERVSGKAGEVGAVSLLTYRAGKGTMEMVETVTKRDLPREFAGTYEAKDFTHYLASHFTDLGDGRTQLITDNEIIPKSLFMKAICLFFPAAFRKTTQEYLDNFKKFAESSI